MNSVSALETATLVLPGGLPVEFCRIPAGEFWMGSREPNPSWIEPGAMLPRHRVRMEHDYWFARTPIVLGAFRTFVDAHRLERTSGGGADAAPDDWNWNTERVSEANQPVVEVSWLDAMRFCDWLNAARQHPQAARKVQWPDHLANCQATLPTEAQWERACRGVAGEGPVEQEYGSGDGAAALATVGWFGLDWNSKIPAVGGKQPTDWGLYDMHGLVWEWVLDEYEADAYGHRPEITIDPLQGAGAKPAKRSADALRVLRGGSWLNSAADCRSAFRDRFRAGVRVRDGGFRVALVPGPSRAPP